MKRIGILGGTFNPPHIGHLLIADEVRHALQLDEIRLMPTAIPPHKMNPNDASPEQRLRMVEMSVEHVDGLTCSSFEVDRGGVSYTYDTMAALKEMEPSNEFFFIIGGDMIDILPQWHRIDELLKLVTFVGVDRPDSNGETTFPIVKVNIPEIDLSSTLIRKRFAEGGPVRFLLPNGVEAFIRKEELYG
ncbi:MULTISPECIES: nicotinate-nucleotide adenylyltransferase [Sporosarcina]|uniref:Probable nicotinate-nucleotide adenylyltransferase n=1 Tax=Sporosarcina contaminans TaxID=633403 RepID=A0ABW3U1X5_9BACL